MSKFYSENSDISTVKLSICKENLKKILSFSPIYLTENKSNNEIEITILDNGIFKEILNNEILSFPNREIRENCSNLNEKKIVFKSTVFQRSIFELLTKFSSRNLIVQPIFSENTKRITILNKTLFDDRFNDGNLLMLTRKYSNNKKPKDEIPSLKILRKYRSFEENDNGHSEIPLNNLIAAIAQKKRKDYIKRSKMNWEIFNESENILKKIKILNFPPKNLPIQKNDEKPIEMKKSIEKLIELKKCIHSFESQKSPKNPSSYTKDITESETNKKKNIDGKDGKILKLEEMSTLASTELLKAKIDQFINLNKMRIEYLKKNIPDQTYRKTSNEKNEFLVEEDSHNLTKTLNFERKMEDLTEENFIPNLKENLTLPKKDFEGNISNIKKDLELMKEKLIFDEKETEYKSKDKSSMKSSEKIDNSSQYMFENFDKEIGTEINSKDKGVMKSSNENLHIEKIDNSSQYMFENFDKEIETENNSKDKSIMKSSSENLDSKKIDDSSQYTLENFDKEIETECNTKDICVGEKSLKQKEFFLKKSVSDNVIKKRVVKKDDLKEILESEVGITKSFINFIQNKIMVFMKNSKLKIKNENVKNLNEFTFKVHQTGRKVLNKTKSYYKKFKKSRIQKKMKGVNKKLLNDSNEHKLKKIKKRHKNIKENTSHIEASKKTSENNSRQVENFVTPCESLTELESKSIGSIFADTVASALATCGKDDEIMRKYSECSDSDELNLSSENTKLDENVSENEDIFMVPEGSFSKLNLIVNITKSENFDEEWNCECTIALDKLDNEMNQIPDIEKDVQCKDSIKYSKSNTQLDKTPEEILSIEKLDNDYILNEIFKEDEFYLKNSQKNENINNIFKGIDTSTEMECNSLNLITETNTSKEVLQNIDVNWKNSVQATPNSSSCSIFDDDENLFSKTKYLETEINEENHRNDDLKMMNDPLLIPQSTEEEVKIFKNNEEVSLKILVEPMEGDILNNKIENQVEGSTTLPPIYDSRNEFKKNSQCSLIKSDDYLRKNVQNTMNDTKKCYHCSCGDHRKNFEYINNVRYNFDHLNDKVTKSKEINELRSFYRSIGLINFQSCPNYRKPVDKTLENLYTLEKKIISFARRISETPHGNKLKYELDKRQHSREKNVQQYNRRNEQFKEVFQDLEKMANSIRKKSSKGNILNKEDPMKNLYRNFATKNISKDSLKKVEAKQKEAEKEILKYLEYGRQRKQKLKENGSTHDGNFIYHEIVRKNEISETKNELSELEGFMKDNWQDIEKIVDNEIESSLRDTIASVGKIEENDKKNVENIQKNSQNFKDPLNVPSQHKLVKKFAQITKESPDSPILVIREDIKFDIDKKRMCSTPKPKDPVELNQNNEKERKILSIKDLSQLSGMEEHELRNFLLRNPKHLIKVASIIMEKKQYLTFISDLKATKKVGKEWWKKIEEQLNTISNIKELLKKSEERMRKSSISLDEKINNLKEKLEKEEKLKNSNHKTGSGKLKQNKEKTPSYTTKRNMSLMRSENSLNCTKNQEIPKELGHKGKTNQVNSNLRISPHEKDLITEHNEFNTFLLTDKQRIFRTNSKTKTLYRNKTKYPRLNNCKSVTQKTAIILPGRKPLEISLTSGENSKKSENSLLSGLSEVISNSSGPISPVFKRSERRKKILRRPATSKGISTTQEFYSSTNSSLNNNIIPYQYGNLAWKNQNNYINTMIFNPSSHINNENLNENKKIEATDSEYKDSNLSENKIEEENLSTNRKNGLRKEYRFHDFRKREEKFNIMLKHERERKKDIFQKFKTIIKSRTLTSQKTRTNLSTSDNEQVNQKFYSRLLEKIDYIKYLEEQKCDSKSINTTKSNQDITKSVSKKCIHSQIEDDEIDTLIQNYPMKINGENKKGNIINLP